MKEGCDSTLVKNFESEFFQIYKRDQVSSNTRVATQLNTSLTRLNTNQHESNTNQHGSDTSQHDSDTSQHEATRVQNRSRP